MIDAKVHVVFVYTHMSLGGVETLILRMSGWLIQHGHRVTVILARTGELDTSFPPGVKVVFAKRAISDYSMAARVGSEFDWLEKELVDIFYSFCYRSAFFALWLVTGLNWVQQPAFLTGIYIAHDALLTGGGRRTWMFPFARDFYRNRIPPSNVVFSNNYFRYHNGRDLGVDFSASHIIPVGLSERLADKCQRRPIRNRIVTVGRLAAFKTYNLAIPGTLRELVKRGHDVHWDIYGSGDLAATLDAFAREAGVLERFRFKPSVPYDRLADVFAETGVFVGTATVAFEAALCGVPTIRMPIYDNQSKCHGWLHEIDENTWGLRTEEGGKDPSIPLVELLENGLTMTDEKYQELSRKDRSKARTILLDVVMPTLLEAGMSCKGVAVRYPRAGRWSYRFLTWMADLKNRLKARRKATER